MKRSSKKILVRIVVFVHLLNLTSCQTIKVQLPSDQLPVLGDSELIRVGLIEKTEIYNFKHLKNRGKRLPILRQIEKLSYTGLAQLKSNKLSQASYDDFASLARIGVQVVKWFAIIENPKNNKSTILLPDREKLAKRMEAHHVLVNIHESLNKNRSTGEDNLLNFLIAVRDSLRQQLKINQVL